jgi:hypothetical protein
VAKERSQPIPELLTDAISLFFPLECRPEFGRRDKLLHFPLEPFFFDRQLVDGCPLGMAVQAAESGAASGRRLPPKMTVSTSSGIKSAYPHLILRRS